MTDTAVNIERLGVAHGPVQAVRGIGFTVAAGEHVTLLGPSGCGKTTTLRAIAGLERPQAGRIVIGGDTVFDAATGRNTAPERRGLSMVFQSYAIWPHMTVFENVAFGFRARGQSGPAMQEAVRRSLALVGLAEYADRPATRLSGGQQQRVALARAIAYPPRVILLDEPLSNLDAQLRLSMRAEFQELRRRLGLTAIYVTHDQEEAMALSDRILVLRDGRVEQEATPEQLQHAPRTRFVAEFLGVRNILACTLEPNGVARMGDGAALAVRPPWPAQAGPALVCFRPATVALSTGAGDAGHTGTITRRSFLGDVAQYAVQSGPLQIIATLAPRPDLVEGAAVRWSVAESNCLVVDP
jgi:iron(III) transport system ATP-binding protein